MFLLEALIEFVRAIWSADNELRDGSLLGQSEMDNQSRRWIGCVCGGTIALLVLVAAACWGFRLHFGS
jgi:hypothetical protein